MSRRGSSLVILAGMAALGWLVGSRIVYDGLDDPRPPTIFKDYRLAFPFARLRIDPVETSFERRGDDLTVFVRCLEPIWAKPRQVRIGQFEAIGYGGSAGAWGVRARGLRIGRSR